MRSMRKWGALGLAAILGIGGLAGCGQKTAETSSDNSTGEMKGDITIWSWDVALMQLQSSAEKFNEQYPDVKFHFEEMGPSQIYDKMTTSLASGIGLPDIITLEGEQMSRFGYNFPDKFEDFSEMIDESKFLPIKMGECKVGDKVIAYPWDSAPAGLFYRTDYFEQAGIKAEDIKTWDDFIEAGKVIDQKLGIKMMSLAESRQDTLYRFMLMQLGSFYFDKEGNSQFNSPESILAMSKVQEIYKAGITLSNNSWDDFVTGIASGKVASFPEAVWMIGSLKEVAPDQSGKWAVMPLPQFSEMKSTSAGSNGGSVITVPTTSKNAHVAKEFVKFAMTDEALLEEGFSNYGLYPSYMPVFESDMFNEEVEYLGGQKAWQMFAEVGKIIEPVNYTENFAEALEMMKGAVARTLLKNENVTATMEQVQAEATNKFGK
ncbi:ABC transporter substrate-binding protein [Niameybacter massiliensis]|uniref:ABC transporter substrate-binding protein n=1 Tax=Niameybacter massiliensis TaxID=1658108 RepID=UPI0006B5C405|nr:sugar ABC transporter substrate-binding protein [Niameybacter massiliensis]